MAAVGVIATVKYYHHVPSTELPVALVQAERVKKTLITEDVQAIGTLTARSVVISPEIAGQVKTIFFKDGATVTSGENLLELNDAVLKAKLDSITAELAYLEGNYHRMRALSKRGYISQDSLEKIESELKKTRALKQESMTTLSRLMLKAPFAGVLGKANVSPGEYINVGQNIVTLTVRDHLRVEYSIPEKYFPLLKLNQQIKITSAAYPGKQFIGKVAFISPTISSDNRSIAVYADVDNSNFALTSGMFVEVSQRISESEGLVVPIRSLMPGAEGIEVYKVINGKAYSAKVVLGRRTDTDAVITQGIAENDMIITDGQLKIKNAMPVKVKTLKDA